MNNRSYDDDISEQCSGVIEQWTRGVNCVQTTCNRIVERTSISRFTFIALFAIFLDFACSVAVLVGSCYLVKSHRKTPELIALSSISLTASMVWWTASGFAYGKMTTKMSLFHMVISELLFIANVTQVVGVSTSSYPVSIVTAALSLLFMVFIMPICVNLVVRTIKHDYAVVKYDNESGGEDGGGGGGGVILVNVVEQADHTPNKN